MGLDDLKPFDPAEKVIEYLLEAEVPKKRLIDMTCKAFAAEETASESPAPGGGSIAAYMRALGAASGRWSPTSRRTRRGGTTAGRIFPTGPNGAGRSLRSFCTSWTRTRRRSTASWRFRHAQVDRRGEGGAQRRVAGGDALCHGGSSADDEGRLAGFEIVRAMASEGNPNSVSDAGVGALAARSAVLGACSM